MDVHRSFTNSNAKKNEKVLKLINLIKNSEQLTNLSRSVSHEEKQYGKYIHKYTLKNQNLYSNKLASIKKGSTFTPNKVKQGVSSLLSNSL